jgi:two-component system chemotaxis sensor kinase CheA
MSGFDISMYRDMFVEEAEELFESADNVLLEAEKNGSLTDDEMGQLFRDVHTLKGSGASVELSYFAEFTHDVENLMDKLRNHQIEYVAEMAGTLIDGLDVMKEILQLECDGEIERDAFTEMTTDLLVTIRAYMNGGAPAETTNTPVVEEAPVIIEEKVESNTSIVNGSWGFFAEESNASENTTSSMDSDENFGFFDDMEAIKPDADIKKVEDVPVVKKPEKKKLKKNLSKKK